MLKKIGLFICALILIPTITNAKLNEVIQIREIDVTGRTRYYNDIITIQNNKNKLLILDRKLNNIGNYNAKKGSLVEYDDVSKTFYEVNERTGELNALDKNFKTISTIKIPNINVYKLNFVDGYLIVDNQGTKTIYTNDLKEVTSFNSDDDIVKITKDRIITYKNNESFISYKTYDRTGKLIKEWKSVHANQNFLLSDGSLVAISNETGISTAYDNNFNEIAKLEGGLLLLTDKNDNVYITYEDPKNPIDPNSQDFILEFKKLKVKKYTKDLKFIKEITMDELLKTPLPVTEFGNITIGDMMYFYKLIIGNYKPQYENYQLVDFAKYKNELFLLVTHGDSTDIIQISPETDEREIIKVNAKGPEDIPSDHQVYEKGEKFIITDEGITVGMQIYHGLPKANIDERYRSNAFISYKVRPSEFNINTMVKGKGSIVVDKLAKPGDKVQFTVTPDKGYVIDKIYMVDKNGYKKEITENFIMPEEDVTIEVIFNVLNPETNSFVPYIVTILIISLIIIIYINREKDKTLRYKI